MNMRGREICRSLGRAVKRITGVLWLVVTSFHQIGGAR